MTAEGNPIQRKKICPVCNKEFPATQTMCLQDRTPLRYEIQDELLGTILNERYRVISEVGRGGMSIVYKGLHEMMDRVVAIKMLQSQHVTDQLSIKRFQQEAQAASHLQHPHVITVYDCGVVASGQPYIVMDFLEGKSLTDLVKEEDHIDHLRAVPIFVQACDALEHAHQKGVIHRDLKSSNIMLIEVEGRKDFVKVVDFGIAKLTSASGKQQQNLTQTGEIFGSPIYMSPEQCLGQQLDCRSDIYSMGAVLYETLTGAPPLMGDTIYATMKMHVAQMPEPFCIVRPDLRIPEALERIAFKAMAKKPEQRYQTMQEMKEALEQCSQFDSQVMPSLISAPPTLSMGYGNTIPPKSDEEDLDLSAGLFGNESQTTGRQQRPSNKTGAPFVSGPPDAQKRTSERGKTVQKGTGVQRSAEGSQKTAVRKPVAKEKKAYVPPAWLAQLKDPKIIGITLGSLLIIGSLVGGALYLNSLGDENPFALVKNVEGTVYYYRSATKDPETNKDIPGLLYMKPSKPNSKLLQFDLSQINISDYSSSANLADLQIGSRWNLRYHKGANNTLVMEAGNSVEQLTPQIADARTVLVDFLNLIQAGDLKNAYELMSFTHQKTPGDADKFKQDFTENPKFLPDYKTKGIPPFALKVDDYKPSEITISIDGHYIFEGDQFYRVNLISEDQKWRIDYFTPIPKTEWQKGL